MIDMDDVGGLCNDMMGSDKHCDNLTLDSLITYMTRITSDIFYGLI